MARDGFTQAEALALWETYNISLQNVRGLPAIFVSYDDLVDDPEAITCRLSHHLRSFGLPTDDVHDRALTFIDTSLRHYAGGHEVPHATLTLGQRRLASRLTALSSGP